MRIYKSTQILFAILCILMLGASTIQAQTVKGKIVDSENEPLIGASVVIKGTTTGTVTDFDGDFSIQMKKLPDSLFISYIGFESKTVFVAAATDNMKIVLGDNAVTLDVGVEIVGQRVSEKQKAAPLTIESMDLLAIKETPSDNFYDGLGSLKGVDLTAASLGFKVINTRGFNSTNPVRSLQIIDGVDNQAPGLNFSLGNFLGASELDVLKVDLVVGASSAFYGPNAFNGVISMETKNPFYQKGFSAMVKGGERAMFEGALRWADAVNNKNGDPVFGYKVNLFYLRADDWIANNEDPVYDTETGIGNPGRYDRINTYGDEYDASNDASEFAPWNLPGLGIFHRTGYDEKDLVDYDTRNTKANVAFHFRTNPAAKELSPEFIVSSNFGAGTTVYQGDNRFSLKNILFFQNRLEYMKKGKYFVRAYTTTSDAGDSYDPYFTALRLQERAKTDVQWGSDYANYWQQNIVPQINSGGYPQLQIVQNPDGSFGTTFDHDAADAWLAANQGNLMDWHAETQAAADQANPSNLSTDFLAPGTPEFQTAFDEIVGTNNNEEGGTRFYDRSSLYHLHGEYKFEPKGSTDSTDGFLDHIIVGANTRLYTPVSRGTIFYDTLQTATTNDYRKIRNVEFGFYTGIQKKLADDKVTLSATLRADKNLNFNWLLSPAASVVWKPKANNYLRFSFSSAIRNPTLGDQYLNLNVGPAILAGNIDGVEGLFTVESMRDYLENDLNVNFLDTFSIAAVRPEKVKSFEIGYRTTLFNKIYVDGSYYFSIYNDFLGYNIGVDATFNNLNFPERIQAYRYSANSTNQVTTQGLAIGLNYYFAKYFAMGGNYSWNKLNSDIDDPIIPAFNTPEHKFNLNISGRNIEMKLGSKTLKNFGFNINYKWIKGFIYEGSPQFTGIIPNYALMDGQINYNVKKINTTFKLGASNILNNKQFQTYGGPRIGRLLYFSLLYEIKKK